MITMKRSMRPIATTSSFSSITVYDKLLSAVRDGILSNLSLNYYISPFMSLSGVLVIVDFFFA
jgi:hypothetical protein